MTTVPAQRRKKEKKTKPILSPFRYPGGKSWLKPIIQRWLTPPATHLVEAFAGGGSVTIAALTENLAAKATIIEFDRDVASVWAVIFNGEADWLVQKIQSFRISKKSVTAELDGTSRAIRERAWRTLLRNRVSHGGIMTAGAGILKRGENDRGLKSRWYSKTLRHRIKGLKNLRAKITLVRGDAVKWLKLAAAAAPVDGTAYFIDPPYAHAGKRLYRHNAVDHAALFKLASTLHGRVLMTYDDTAEIRKLAAANGLEVREIEMRSRQNRAKTELLISREFSWLENANK